MSIRRSSRRPSEGESDPRVRFACALAVHAFEIDTGPDRAPFDQTRAERYAREPLMPADEFGPLAGWADAALAALFGVPVEQVGVRRLELARRSIVREPPP